MSSLRRANLFEPEFDHSSERDGYRWQGLRVGRHIGGKQIGASLYELGDGERTYPYHFHHGTEEWVLVVSGTPVLRGPDGERTLRAGDVVCFPARGGRRASRHGARPGADPVGELQPRGDRVSGQRQGGRAAGQELPGRRRGRLLGRRVNLYDVVTKQDDDDPPGLSGRFSADRPGNRRRLPRPEHLRPPARKSICPYHYEQPEEEWLLVLTGRPTLRVPDGEHELEPGDVVCFPAGPDGAHKVTNRGPEPSRVGCSTKSETGVAVYPDGNKVGVFPLRQFFRIEDAVDYWEDEPPA